MERRKEIKIRLNEIELEHLDELVKRSGRSREAYVRSLIRGIVPSDKPSEQTLEMIQELRHIGNNLNQIARVANASGKIDTNAYFENVENLYRSISEIRKLLSQGTPIDLEGA